MNRFQDRVAFVSGAANGIGRACMNRLAREGAIVVAVDRKADDLEAAVGELTDEGRNVTAIVADVMEESRIETAFCAMDGISGGRLDISIHVAGNSMFGTVESLSSADWERLWRLNVLSTVICCRLAVQRMKTSGGGAIVNMSSISGLAGDPGWGPYNSAKAAIWNLTQCLAWEVGRYDIRGQCDLSPVRSERNACSGASRMPRPRRRPTRHRIPWVVSARRKNAPLPSAFWPVTMPVS